MSDSTRRLVALVVLALGTLQAWDSGALAAGPIVAALALAGVAVAGLPLLLTRDLRVAVAGIITSAVVLTVARIVSPTPLNELHLIVFIGAIGVLATSGVLRRTASPR